MTDFSALDQLVDIITSGVASIKRAYTDAGIAAPCLDEPWKPTPVDQQTESQALIVASAAAQLVATLRTPNQLLFEAVYGIPLHVAGILALQKLHIPELIREGGPQGTSVEDLGKITETDPQRLVRVLRHVAVRHVLREVTPGVYAHNRLSSTLDSGVPYESIIKDPLAKFTQAVSPSVAGLIELGEDFLLGAAIIPELMTRPGWSFKDDVHDAAVAHAYTPGVDLPPSLFEAFMQPGFELRRVRFNASMVQQTQTYSLRTLLDGFAWEELSPGSLVVDVGGGVGSAALAVLRTHPDLRFVVQDLAAVVENEGRKFWASECPEAIADGRVVLQTHDFFVPQPAQPSPVAVFLLRCVTHDWPASAMRDMLRALAAGAEAHTRVVIVDHVVPYTSMTSSELQISCAPAVIPPKPLLASAGYEGVFDRDMIMSSACNGLERTAEEFVEMCKGTPWSVEAIHRAPPGGMSQIVLSMAL